jgi:hypothetical protein
MKRNSIINLSLAVYFSMFLPNSIIHADYSSEYWDRDFQKTHISIKSTTGKFYAYIVLLFNENPHFINLIQENSLTTEMQQKEGFHVKEFNNYLESLKNIEIRKMAELLLNIYLYPAKFNEKALEAVQEELIKYNVILNFSKVKSNNSEKIALDYCIYGRREPINISHPLFEIQEKIFNIQPFIYYDEFYTTNSTFYFDMIYINPEEVNNDFLIAQHIISGKNVDSMLYVGARITDDIKYCISRAFPKSGNIKADILNMFFIHEMTHKILNNHYNYFDQVTGEELALLSTMYPNPYYGLSVLYAYLDYNRIHPHRIAAVNIIRYISNKTGKPGLIDNPSDLKFISINELKRFVKEYFVLVVKNIKNNN